MSGTEATSLAAMAAGVDEEDIKRVLEQFRLDARFARHLWDAWLREFDKSGREGQNYSSALKTFVVRYEHLLKEGA